MQSRKWEDRDGNKRISWEVQVQNVYLADSKRDGNTQAVPAAPQMTELPANEGELPF